MSIIRSDAFNNAHKETARLLMMQYANGVYQIGRYLPRGRDIPAECLSPFSEQNDANTAYQHAVNHMCGMGYQIDAAASATPAT